MLANSCRHPAEASELAASQNCGVGVGQRGGERGRGGRGGSEGLVQAGREGTEVKACAVRRRAGAGVGYQTSESEMPGPAKNAWAPASRIVLTRDPAL